MKVLVCGGRDFSDYARLRSVLESLHAEREIRLIVHGCAQGADRLAGEWAKSALIQQWGFFADWNRHGRAAGSIRNAQMLTDAQPDLVVAFPGGRGTADMVRRAKAAGVRVIEVDARGEEGTKR